MKFSKVILITALITIMSLLGLQFVINSVKVRRKEVWLEKIINETVEANYLVSDSIVESLENILFNDLLPEVSISPNHIWANMPVSGLCLSSYFNVDIENQADLENNWEKIAKEIVREKNRRLGKDRWWSKWSNRMISYKYEVVPEAEEFNNLPESIKEKLASISSLYVEKHDYEQFLGDDKGVNYYYCAGDSSVTDGNNALYQMEIVKTRPNVTIKIMDTGYYDRLWASFFKQSTEKQLGRKLTEEENTVLEFETEVFLKNGN
jgi:hypothetical protein